MPTDSVGAFQPDFKVLFEGSPHPYLVIGSAPRFIIVAVNDRYLEATGTRRAEVLGRGLFEVFPDNPEDPAANGVSDLRRSLERVLRDRVQDIMGVQKYDIPCPAGDGSFQVKYWSPVNTPIPGPDGEPAYIIHHVEDVTEFILAQQEKTREAAQQLGKFQERADRKEAEVLRRAAEVKDANRRLKIALEELEQSEAELTRLNEKLHELDRSKTRFFGNVSHELRTPLTLMLGPLEETLCRAQANLLPQDRENLSIAHRNGLRLLKLVNTLLDFSRIKAGRLQATYRPTDLATLTGDLAAVFRSAMEKGGLELVVSCEPAPEPVYLDRDMWEKIVLNLLSNAFKFTLAGRVTVELRARPGGMELTVADTGCGIAPEELENIFERFHRVEGTRGRAHEGTGIGLALVEELVKLQGGSIRVASEVGRGTVFTVTIPFGTDHLPAGSIADQGASPASPVVRADEPFLEESLRWLLDTDPRTPAEADGSPAAQRRPRILLADDNADMRAYIGKLLGGCYQVSEAADGEAAWRSIREKLPDLVLTDVMMPELDGFGLLARLRSDAGTRSIPVVMLSARAGEESRVEGIEAGADDYLVKPFSARELAARVRTNLEMARLREASARVAEHLRAKEEANAQLEMGGYLSARNIGNGAEFRIEVGRGDS